MIIYKIINKINGKIYIGQTIRTLKERINSYRREVDDRPIVHAMKKHGVDNFTFETVDTAENIDELNAKEMHWIELLDATNKNIGYNLRAGGSNSPLPKSAKEKLRAARQSKDNPFYGKTHSDKIKIEMSKRMTGENNTNFGKIVSEETKILIRNSKIKYKGENHPRFGASLSVETKNKIRESLQKLSNAQVEEAFLLRKAGYSYRSIGEKFGLSRATIARYLKRK